MFLLQVLQADLQVQLSNSCNNVLPGLLDGALHHRVGLGQASQALHQFGQQTWVFGLHCNFYYGAYTELHHLHLVSLRT